MSQKTRINADALLTERMRGLRSRPGALSRRRSRVGAALVLPAFFIVVVFFFVPLGFAFYMSLTNWPLVGTYNFIGLQNYEQLVHDNVFIHSILFTLEYTVIITPAAFLVGYGLAVLSRQRVARIGVFRTIYFLPFVVGLSTLSFMAILEFQPNSGIVGFILAKLGLGNAGTSWLVSPGTALLGICILVVWSQTGLTMLILLGGMQAISRDVYEAASVDGATAWQREVRITVPLLRRSIALSLIISVIGSLLAFNQFQILTGGGPGTNTATVVLWIYQVAFVQFHLGYAAAMSIVLLIIVVLVSILQFVLLRQDATE